MNTTLIVLLVGLLGLIVLALGVLVWAVRHAADGYEDETGFHFAPKHGTEKRKKRVPAVSIPRKHDRTMGPIEPVLN